MKFYLYVNKNNVFDYLSRNIIASSEVVQDIKNYRTIGNKLDYFLFITHKKLNRMCREKGIADVEMVCPMTLEISDIQEMDGKAVLISINENNPEYQYDSLSNYDSEKHVGACVVGEIPFSRIEKIYFDSLEDMEMFNRPSPDYWYPKEKYELLPSDFSDELELDLNEEKILETCGLIKEDIISEIQQRERYRAALLNFVNGSLNWQYGKYIFSFDNCFQQLFGLSDESLNTLLPHYLDMKDRDNVEYLSLIPNTYEKSPEFDQVIYDKTFDIFSQNVFNKSRQPKDVSELLEIIKNDLKASIEKETDYTFLSDRIEDIEGLILDSNNLSPEEIMANIPEAIDVLKAIIFVAKNSTNYNDFLESLKAYHVDNITKRRAMTLWGALNGLYGMPGEGFNKDNNEIWTFIESLSFERFDSTSVRVKKPLVTIENGKVFNIEIKEEEIITAEEIRSLILSQSTDKLHDVFYEKLLEVAKRLCGSDKKAEVKGYIIHTASADLNEIKRGDLLNADSKKILEQLLKDYKKSCPNKELLYKDFVENPSNFEQVFESDKEYWKKVYRNRVNA